MRSKLLHIGLPIALILAMVALLSVAIFKYQNKEKDDAVAVTVPVELKASSRVNNANIGMILTIGNESAEGSQWNQAASGAQVAAERFSRGGTKINLLTENDKGTSDGARQAIDHLADQKVSGIIIASSGPHIQTAIDEAASRNIPVILPYAQANNGAWSLQANTQDLKKLTQDATSSSNKVIRLDQTGFISLDVPAETTKPIAADTDFSQLAKDLAKDTEDQNKNFSVIVNADSYTQAKFLRAIQGIPIHSKIILGTEATSPAFEQTFMKDQPASIVEVLSPGIPSGDTVALQSDGQGRSMSSYLQAVKIYSASTTSSVTFAGQKFSELAISADSRSHDALVVFVRAIEKADSTDSNKIRQILPTMKFLPASGITSQELGFAKSQVQNEQAHMLSATIGNLQLRSFDKNLNPTILWVPKA